MNSKNAINILNKVKEKLIREIVIWVYMLFAKVIQVCNLIYEFKSLDLSLKEKFAL